MTSDLLGAWHCNSRWEVFAEMLKDSQRQLINLIPTCISRNVRSACFWFIILEVFTENRKNMLIHELLISNLLIHGRDDISSLFGTWWSRTCFVLHNCTGVTNMWTDLRKWFLHSDLLQSKFLLGCRNLSDRSVRSTAGSMRWVCHSIAWSVDVCKDSQPHLEAAVASKPTFFSNFQYKTSCSLTDQ